MKTLYDLLAVSPDADAKPLKIAFRRAVKANHPDLHPEDPRVLPKFMQIVAANSILSDAVQRAAYDQSLKYHQSLKLERQRLRLEERRLLILEGRGLLIGTAIVLSVIVVGAHWIYRNSQTIVTAINSNPRAARIEIVAGDIGAETIGNGPYGGRNDVANFSAPATDVAPAFANLWLASGLETMVAAPGANYDRNQPVVDAGTVINHPAGVSSFCAADETSIRSDTCVVAACRHIVWRTKLARYVAGASNILAAYDRCDPLAAGRCTFDHLCRRFRFRRGRDGRRAGSRIDAVGWRASRPQYVATGD